MLKFNIIAYKRGNTIFDLHHHSIENDMVPILRDSNEGINILKNSFVQVLQLALNRIYNTSSNGMITITPSGFYYDFIGSSVSSNDFNEIEKKINEIIKENIPFKKNITKNINEDNFFKRNEEDLYTMELGDFQCLSNGAQLLSTAFLGDGFKLVNISEVCHEKLRVQRIEVFFFSNQEKLIEHLNLWEKEKANDHRIIGKPFFWFSEMSSGIPFWTALGQKLRLNIESYLRKLLADNYEEVRTPFIMNNKLWQLTGHAEKYDENMFHTENGCLTPMNCPGHALIFSQKNLTYKDLPIRISEFGICHRREDHGGLLGLKRSYALTIDDGHIFCEIQHIVQEVTSFIKMAISVYKEFNLKLKVVKISTRPEKYIGDLNNWNEAEKILKETLNSCNIEYVIAEGDGAFYGPKIELHVEDNLNRTWQCGTIQVDFFLSERLDCYYIDSDGKKKNPVILHRAILGSMERFIAIILENGLPLRWHPSPVVFIIISNNEVSFESQIKELKVHIPNSTIDLENENINNRIKKWIGIAPLIVVCGIKELQGIDASNISNMKINVRNIGDMTIKELKDHINNN